MEIIKKYLRNDLLIASILLLIISNIGSLINFAFQFIMARMLTSEDFGILSFVITLLFVFGVPSLAIQTAIAKKTTQLNMKKEYGKIRGIFNYSTKRLLILALILIPVFILGSYFIHDYVHMPLDILVITSFALIFSLLLPVIMGIMQGMKKFMTLGWNNVINFSIKLLAGIFFVYLGFRVYGALIGLLLGMFIAWIIGIFVVARYKEEKQEINLFSKEELFPFIGLLVITLLYSLDILIGKFILAPGIMGDYSKISLIGKIVLFACMTVTTVMFPLSSERHALGNNPSGIIRKAGLLIFFICLASMIMAWIFPSQLLMLLFGKNFVYLAPLFFPVIVAFSSLSGIVLLVLSRISTEKFGRKEALLTILTLIIQIASLVIFGSNISSFSNALMISSIINFILLYSLLKR